jgi:hypothetical protein
MPAWMPGARFKSKVDAWRRYAFKMITEPFAAAKQATVRDETDVLQARLMCVLPDRRHCPAILRLRAP